MNAYKWASVLARLVKNLLAIWETWLQSLGWEDPLEKGKATHSSILAWRIPWTVDGVTKSQTRLSNFHFSNQTCSPHPQGDGGGNGGGGGEGQPS